MIADKSHYELTNRNKSTNLINKLKKFDSLERKKVKKSQKTERIIDLSLRTQTHHAYAVCHRAGRLSAARQASDKADEGSGGVAAN